MTAAPRFTVPRDDRRECALYRIMVVHPITGKIVLGYIGETGRMPWVRFMEHLYDQPWGDTIVGHPHVDPRVFSGKSEVLAAEEAAVLAEKPLYNDEYQRHAPHRIPQWTAREQRAERDRMRGAVTPDWAANGQAAGRPAPVANGQSKSSSAKDKRRLGWAAGWLAVTLTAWLTLALSTGTLAAPWTVWPILSAGVCAEPLVLLYRGGRKRQTWRVRKGLALAIAVATVVLLVMVWQG